ncbi:DUF4411 family protein [Mitsuaria sp. CC2]|jgi:hypothetical protein|uniref:DUF4411 family protein n=1 Tax=Mitsuaria sp. CC2 TaxID=3029186 RepID=UPI003B8AF4CE
MAYLLDANVFLEARKTYYGMDFCPAFWRWLTVSQADGQVFSVTQVRDELTDEVIVPWVAAQSPGFWLDADETVAMAIHTVVEWVNKQGLLDPVLFEFMDSADMYLVVHGLARGDTVVTLEKSARGSKKKIKIPDVCAAVGVRCIEPHVMLRELQARFVLGPIHEPYEGANLAKISKDEPPRTAAADVQEALLRSVPTGTD